MKASTRAAAVFAVVLAAAFIALVICRSCEPEPQLNDFERALAENLTAFAPGEQVIRAELCVLCRRHAAACAWRQVLAHDLGDGGPQARFNAQGMGLRVAEVGAVGFSPDDLFRRLLDSQQHREIMALDWPVLGVGSAVWDDREDGRAVVAFAMYGTALE